MTDQREQLSAIESQAFGELGITVAAYYSFCIRPVLAAGVMLDQHDHTHMIELLDARMKEITRQLFLHGHTLPPGVIILDMN